MAKGIETKELILEKSAELFNMHGYDGCSLNDIMTATGLQKGGIYNHFKNKDEIAAESFNYSMKKIIDRFRERLDNDNSSWEKLVSVITTIGSFAYDPVIEGGCPMFNTAVNSAYSYPALKVKAQEGLNMLLRYVEIKIEQGIESGEFKVIDDIKETASLVVTTVEGGVVMGRVYDDFDYVKRAELFMIKYLEDKLK